jgi:hypothetical protein
MSVDFKQRVSVCDSSAARRAAVLPGLATCHHLPRSSAGTFRGVFNRCWCAFFCPLPKSPMIASRDCCNACTFPPRARGPASFVCSPVASVRSHHAMIRAKMRAKWSTMAGLLVSLALAFGQAGQPQSGQQQTAAQPPTATQPQTTKAPSNQASPPHQTNDKCPCKPWTVVDAANAAKQSTASQPPAKVYKNKDVKDPASASAAPPANSSALAPAASQAASVPATQPAATTSNDSPVEDPAAFKARGDVFKNEMKAEKEKLAAIQNRITNLKYQYDVWAESSAQDDGALSCWTSEYYSNKDWCDTGRDLKAQYDAAQRQLQQEKAHLETMQEAIRRQGYGNAVYDPD